MTPEELTAIKHLREEWATRHARATVQALDTLLAAYATEKQRADVAEAAIAALREMLRPARFSGRR